MQILNEKKKSEIISQSQKGKPTKSYGTTRYDRRSKVKIMNTVRNFDNIDMNAVFKSNQLTLKLPIKGETQIYEVTVLFRNICDELKREIRANNNFLEYKCCYKAIVKAIEHQDIYLHCSCPDWKYRMAFWSTKDRYNAGDAQLVPAKVTNPNNDLGAGCKHVLNALTSLTWASLLAVVLNNYIKYMKEHYEDKYKKLIEPVLYDEDMLMTEEPPEEESAYSDEEEIEHEINNELEQEGETDGA